MSPKKVFQVVVVGSILLCSLNTDCFFSKLSHIAEFVRQKTKKVANKVTLKSVAIGVTGATLVGLIVVLVKQNNRLDDQEFQISQLQRNLESVVAQANGLFDTVNLRMNDHRECLGHLDGKRIASEAFVERLKALIEKKLTN